MVSPDICKDKIMKIRTKEVRSAGMAGILLAECVRDYCSDSKVSDYKIFKKDIRNICNLYITSRPNAVPLRNFSKYILDILNSDCLNKNISEIKFYIKNKCEKYVEYTKKATVQIGKLGNTLIQNGDKLMLYGHSEPVLAILAEIWDSEKNINLTVVETHARSPEGIRTAIYARNLGFPVRFVCDSAIGDVIENNNKILLGCEGINLDGSIINTIGTKTIAILSKEFKKEVYVAGETLKINYENEFRIENRPISEIINDEKLKYELELLGVDIFNPSSDKTPSNYINKIITEKGIIEPINSIILNLKINID
jgi:translation initiation factor 2B subunit (eIF-2B alpha/beta/delta family)